MSCDQQLSLDCATVRNRRILLLAANPGEGRFTQPTAAIQTWQPELVFMPQSGPLPRLCPNALPLQATTLGDRVGEILLLCRSSTRHTVRPAARFPLAGGGAGARNAHK